MRIVASVEARMGSSRFPGKVLADVHGEPAMGRLVRRLRRSRRLDDVVLAIPRGSTDDPLEAWARAEGVAVHRGSEDDVLARVVGAHRQMGTDLIVEVTGDCVLLDPEVIDLGIDTFLANECDVVTNVRQASFPMGVDVQVFRFRDLEEVAERERDPAVREHVSLYFYEHPERYRIIHLLAPPRWRAPELRLQLDYAEDYRFIQEIYRRLAPELGDGFGVDEILRLLEREPALLEINAHCVEKAVR